MEKEIRKVFLEPVKHKYYDETGREYKSVTKVLGLFVDKFDSSKMAPLVAKKRKKDVEEEALRRGVSVSVILSERDIYERGITTEGVIRDWERKRDDANERGTAIHNMLEDFILNKFVPERGSKEYKLCNDLSKFLKGQNYYMAYPEVVLHLEDLGVAGTSDLRCKRTKSINSVIDYYDYKTNDIVFDSGKYKEGKKKHNDRFMKYPLEHLEDCNYNKYALQLSFYAYMDQQMYNSRIGRLGIINVVNGFELIPVPYMKKEIELIIKYLSLYDVIPC
jgi:adenine-specific DNA methylase